LVVGIERGIKGSVGREGFDAGRLGFAELRWATFPDRL